MNELARLWVLSFTKPLVVFRIFQFAHPSKAIRFTWWTTLSIYIISYLSLIAIFFGLAPQNLGAMIFLLVLIFGSSLTLVKNYFYTLILSYKTKKLVSYQSVCLISALSDTPLIFAFPLLYLLSLYIGGGMVMVLFFILLFFLLRSRSQIFQNLYGVSTRFIYGVSLGIWANLFILFFLFIAYLGLSVGLLVRYLSLS